MSGRSYGILLASIATLMWSSAGLFVRLLDLDTWTTLGWRSLFGGLTLLVISLYQERRPRLAGAPGSIGLYVFAGVIAGLSMYGYIAAIKLTTVANVLAIYATTPFICAAIAFFWMREKPDRRVMIASGISLVGVLIVVGFAARLDDIAGNGMALLMTVAFAYLLVLARRQPGLKLAPVNAIGSWLCVLLALPLMSHQIPSATELAILAVFGSTTSGLAYLLFMTGSRYIQAAEAGLIGLTDILLGPLWVFLVFGENPGLPTTLGGILILFSVLWYMWGRLRAAQAIARQRARTSA
jgi:drug/metabolite transporter (DMT)-like permease